MGSAIRKVMVKPTIGLAEGLLYLSGQARRDYACPLAQRSGLFHRNTDTVGKFFHAERVFSQQCGQFFNLNCHICPTQNKKAAEAA